MTRFYVEKADLGSFKSKVESLENTVAGWEGQVRKTANLPLLLPDTKLRKAGQSTCSSISTTTLTTVGQQVSTCCGLCGMWYKSGESHLCTVENNFVDPFSQTLDNITYLDLEKEFEQRARVLATP